MEQEKIEQFLGPQKPIHKEQVLRTIQRYCQDVRTRINKCLQEYNISECLDATSEYLTSRPLLLAGVIAVISAIALPVLVFTIFAITTVACTFTGFILIEGTILSIGTVVLCGVLLSIIASLVILGICLSSTYYILLQVYNVIKRI